MLISGLKGLTAGCTVKAYASKTHFRHSLAQLLINFKCWSDQSCIVVSHIRQINVR